MMTLLRDGAFITPNNKQEQRPRVKHFDNSEVKKLANLIDVIARKCWRGLPSLMGDAPQPTRAQLKEALFFNPSPEEDLGTKVQGGHDEEGREIKQEDAMIDNVDLILASFQWSELVNAVQWYAREYPELWGMYRKFLVMSETLKSGWGRDGALARTAEAFGVSDYVVREAVRDVPYKIAKAVSMGFCLGEVLPGLKEN